MELFTPSRSLLNPKFEGYKLDPISQADVVARFPLQYKPTQATISGKTSFSFQEIQSRVTHNHIAVCSDAGRALYVDSDSRVILIDIDAGTLSPIFRILFELPTSIQSGAVATRNHEYPSAAFLTSNTVFVSDGRGVMYVLQIKDEGPSEAVGVFVLSSSSMDSPFRIHGVHRTSPTTAIAILSSRFYGVASEVNSETERSGKAVQTAFDIWGAKIELLSLRPKGDIHVLDILWRRRGQEVPFYTAYPEATSSFLLLGGTSYREIDVAPPPSYEPKTNEYAPIPRADELLDMEVSGPPKPSPYSWSQTPDAVNVAIPLPANTPQHTITVLFSQQTVTVHIDEEIETSVPIPRYSEKRLWDGISPSSSYWTWDREAEHSFGLLTLYLDKQHEGTRWSQVFAPSGPDDVEVVEALDPSELWQIREALEKYTTALREGDDASGLGSGRGVSSLAEGEMDMEVDGSVGRAAYLTWVGEDGSTPPWWKNAEEISFQLLSTPIPGSDPSNVSLVVKNNLDGTVHSLNVNAANTPEWAHTSTFSALAFVLASKRDTRFTYHAPNAVFAFEGGVRDRGGNVYIYRASPVQEKWAKQAILKVDDGYGGSLLGVGAVKAGQGIPIILCLTEGELVLIKNP
ncbi:NudC domain-containing protein 1 [Hypsizygus marmoreus]|uniref:NudC domain-containing protein 1 n=1 Tax=Hypsizygus marmoreus TaxID=39966 RepID=A0A369JBM6_HYPMA|nr:NudC domain-containing protein 1 [Hypsizygus marmoreus]